MPRLNQDGKTLRAVLSYLTNTDVSDAEIARALNIAPTTHQARKNTDDYPSFSELATIATHFKLSARVLQIVFGWRGEDELSLLNDEEMRQYIQQGGGVSPLERTLAPVVHRDGTDDHWRGVKFRGPGGKIDPNKPPM